MAKILNLTECGAKRNDGRSCYVSLPPHIQNAIMTLVTLASHDDNDTWRGAKGTVRTILTAQNHLYRETDDLGISRKTVENALQWAETNTSLALRSTKKIIDSSAPTAG